MPTVTVPLTVAPLAGLVKLTVSGAGGGGGVPLLATVTLIDAEPVLPVASRALAVSVCAPLGVSRESQSSVTGMLLDVCVLTTLPPADSVTVDAPLAPLTQIVTHTTSLTVDPAPGLVMATFSVPPVGGGGDVVFCTVTVIVAVTVRPAASLALSARVLIPSDVRRESQSSETGMLLDVWLFTTVPETLRVTVDGAVAPSTHTVTQTTPLTVAPALGVVTATRSAEAPLETVTVMLDIAVRPPESVTVAASV